MSERRFILIAEDEPDTASLLQFHLHRHGYRTAVAGDGLDALNAMFDHPPDLLILDLMLPGMQGLEVFRLMKASPTACHVPVIMLTALASMEQKLEGFRLGADDYLTKPFEMRELLARVHALLSRTQN